MIDFKIGDIVFHDEYGHGIIVDIGEGYIEREFVDVQFGLGVVRVHNSYLRL